MARDRDESGRARNARARDALGRPLPRGVEGVPRVPEDAVFTPAEALDAAQDYLDRGQAFHAHEVFEAMWKQTETADRELWQGLAQLAVAITHVQRGNPRGALALLRRATTAIDLPAPPHDIDTAGLVEHAERLAEDLEAGHEIGTDRLRPRVRRQPPVS
jgi:uncharacterized protein